ncbi:MAG TPA: CHAT domain-containing protein [Thermoanaerobaculia bacterium]|nr:CHAT domain-containing protein [Thermoanaerobaculia bacterium]
MIIEQHTNSPDDRTHVETILIFAANPEDQVLLSLEREAREIANGLRRSPQRFVVKHVWAARHDDLRRALFDYRPTYVHFCGHGTGIGGIALEGQLVTGGALANLFRLFAKTVRCVILNACYSEIQAQAIARHIDFVVGMNKAIGDQAAVEFSAAFYDALGAGEEVETAFDFGRNAIQLAGHPEHLTPELLIRDPNGPPRRLSKQGRDWDGAPAVSLLYGREAVAEMLRSWILEDFCKVVLITGMGGIGKTDLATCLGRGGNRTPHTSLTLASGIEGHFEAVLWRSLLNAPLPEQLFADIIGITDEHNRSLPSSATERMEEVIRCLHQRRCLLILDNVEAVLRPNDPDMRYREGFELYGTFFERVAKTTHQSCLLLTSREKPHPITTLEGDRKPVRSLALSGIGSSESKNLFAQISTFSGSDRHWDEIVKLYGGNPLALELVARHIHEVYGGDLDAFVRSGHALFRDVETLLDWHVERLAESELELLDWLAIEREPVTLEALQEDLLSHASRERLASTLQGLRRRMPLEPVRRQYALQPVLIEHATARIVKRVTAALRKAIDQALHSLADGGSAKELVAAMQILNSHALIKASAKENVRESQVRLILNPIAEQLRDEWCSSDLRLAFDSLLHVWRGDSGNMRGYAAGNVINLLAQLGLSLDRIDVSRLAVWQACVDDIHLHAADFSFANFRQTTFRHALGTVFAVSYSPDGTLIAAGDDNGNVRLFSASNGELRVSCGGHADTVASISFDAGGRVMASGSYDNTIRLWDPSDGSCKDILLGHDGWVYAVAVSPDGRRLVSGSEDGTCQLWDLQTGTSKTLPTPGASFLAAVAFSPDGNFIAAGGGGGIVYVYRVDAPEQPTWQLRGHGSGVRAIAFSRQGDLMATGGEDRLVNLWAAGGDTHLATLEGHSATVTSLSFSAAGDVLVSGSVDYAIRLWSTARYFGVGQLQGSANRVWAVACSPKERTFVAASEDGAVRVWDIDARERLLSLHGYSNKTWGLDFCQPRSRLIAANEDGVVRVWDPRDGRTALELRGHSTRIWAVASSADGRWAASASDDGTVRIWDLASRTAKHVLTGHRGWIRAVAFDPDSRRLASAAEDGNLIVWNVDSGTRHLTVESGMTRLFAVAFCGASEFIAIAGSEPVVRVVSAADGRRIGDLDGHRGWINALFPANANTLVSCSDDGTMKLWDLKTGRCEATFVVGHKIFCGAVWPQERFFISGSDDGVLRRWNADTEQCDTETRAHHGPIWSVAVDNDGQTVATAGDDGVIRLWLLPDLTPCTTPNALRSPRPYEAMNITGATGLLPEQKNALIALGAIEMPAQ